MQLKTLLQQQHANLALMIGNGINRYGTAQDNSWDALLAKLAGKYAPNLGEVLSRGMSLTEYYDILELNLSARAKTKNGTKAIRSLQQEFCQLMASWSPQAQHHHIMDWARHFDVPVLTSNFEHSLSDASNSELFHFHAQPFTDFYPWESYFGHKALSDPRDGFGIWHVNGMQRYPRSIRLGLTHYMGAVERARVGLHKGSSRLSAGADIDTWTGASSWLQILFHKPLLIVGLALAENEVFLRWLLIERAKYYRQFGERYQPAWYVHVAAEPDIGKHLFLNAVGVKPFPVAGYDEIYQPQTWAI